MIIRAICCRSKNIAASACAHIRGDMNQVVQNTEILISKI